MQRKVSFRVSKYHTAGLKSSIWNTHSMCVIDPVVTLPEIAPVFVSL